LFEEFPEIERLLMDSVKSQDRLKLNNEFEDGNK